MEAILLPVILVAGIGLVLGLGLAIASKIMAVPVDEKAEAITECLPGANCGACGYSGCDGYAKALSEFDAWLPKFMDKLGEDDLVMITADHGCDPGYTATTDHTREYVPLLAIGKGIAPVSLGVRTSFADQAATVSDLLGISLTTEGISFAKEIVRQ